MCRHWPSFAVSIKEVPQVLVHVSELGQPTVLFARGGRRLFLYFARRRGRPPPLFGNEVEKLLASHGDGVAAAGRFLETMVVGNHGQLFGRGMTPDERFDHVVGFLPAVGKTNVQAVVGVLRIGPGGRYGGVEDYRNRRRLVAKGPVKQAEQTQAGFLKSSGPDRSGQNPQGVNQIVAIDQKGHHNGMPSARRFSGRKKREA
jgi:hypothetical protein